MISKPIPRVAYVVKRYPRFSETFIVNELIAHEAQGHALEIVSLYPPNDTHFQDTLGRVRAPVSYLSADGLRAADLWNEFDQASKRVPCLWAALASATGAQAREVYQAARLARLAIERNITWFHAHFASTATTVARLASLMTGIPFSFTAHAKDIFHESVDAPDLRRKLVDAAAVVTVSDFNVSHLKTQFGEMATSRVRRVYNGIELERFTWTSAQQRQPLFVAVGRFVEKKGFDVLLEACAHLMQVRQDWVCELIGSGDLEDELRQQADRLKLGDRVTFLGALPQSEVIRRVRTASAFVAPCVVGQDGNADGLPTVLLEAMALGTPCISTDVTGIPEVIRSEHTGLIVPQRDSVRLAAAMRRLLDDAELRSRVSVAARALIEAEFDLESNARTLWKFFESMPAGSNYGPGRLTIEEPSSRHDAFGSLVHQPVARASRALSPETRAL